MATQFIKNGKLVSHPFAGMSYDLKRLTQDQGTHLSVIMEIKNSFLPEPRAHSLFRV